jgi:TonB family protein
MRFAALALLAALLAASALADEAPDGLAQMVDSPALKSAFAKASSGEVALAVDVAADGRIEHPRILRSTPPGVFDDAALAMVASRHLRPGSKDGVPVPVKDRHITLRFQADAEPPAQLDAQP